jgi:hypothetical protein
VARRRIASTQLDLVRERATQSLQLDALQMCALQMCKVLAYACGAIATIIPFHRW